MRLSISLVLASIALASLAGCATTGVTQSRDASVRVEPRRVSAATASDAMPTHIYSRRAY